MSQVQTEHVLVVPTAKFHELGHFQGFSADASQYLPALLSGELTSYRPRGEMEDDPSFKQLIPYCLFTYQCPEQGLMLFRYTRGRGQGEQRLHAKKSLGIGGHISVEDHSESDNESSYATGMRRELDEEIQIDTPFQERMVGLINDDETEVGRVHLGVVHLFTVEAPRIEPREADIAETGFATVAEILAESDQYETWSQICLNALFAESSAR